MRSATGRWVSGKDFFDREGELEVLKTRVRERNHALLTGQRRMGKTSILRELGSQLESDGWTFLFADVEGATCAEDAIAEIARAAHPVRPIASRFARTMRRALSENVEEISAIDFSVKIRAGLDAGSWKRLGEQLLRDCAAHDRPVLLVIDELPIFLKRMVNRDGDARHVDEFLSWHRGVLQSLDEGSLVLIVSGSIGLEPLVQRLGIPDRINHLFPFRLGPWSPEASIACFEQLARSHGLSIGDGVAEAAYEALGIGIPHHVQSFFARLRDFSTMHGGKRVTVEDVDHVYRTELLGPWGQADLVHYASRLKEALDSDSYSLAMQILAEAAAQGVFTTGARLRLSELYSAITEDASGRVADTLEILIHDGYLEGSDEGYRFPSRLLRDWWSARFRDHYIPLASQRANDDSGEST